MAAFGNFVWVDLETPDPERAIGFYTETLGWNVQEGDMDGTPYRMFAVGQETVGGVMQLAPELQAQGVPPHWMSYIFVPNVDEKVRRAQQLGATVLVPPTEIPNIGRFSILADPQTAAFALYQSNDPSKTRVHRGPGFPCWFELTTTDHHAAKAFYAEIAGFRPSRSHDMGPEGTYDMFTADEPNGPPIVGMWTAPKNHPAPPNWLPYFEVADIEAAVARVRAHGGTVLNGPMEVPDGTRVAQCVDPTGAHFGLNQR